MSYDNTAMEVNTHDFLVFPVFVAAAAVALGILDSTLMGFDLSTTLLDLGENHALSIANGLAIASLGVVAYTNDWHSTEMTGIQAWLIVATVGMVIAPPFFPVFTETLAETPGALVALAVQCGGFLTFSWLG
ncbi:hypothetical protein SAMN05216226_106103 [Halovenus aranensis]|uniref:Uncharacterized protein n=1 Tax=Halovenus aranensis TaxID=890420 RepID=A0A1G8VAP7_9EURY|nr:hypothetical protein [Halovenus aranensis]SDJ63073.1 hypothetical protein SAMN05216226_106103 [Halovenus aranensis]